MRIEQSNILLYYVQRRSVVPAVMICIINLRVFIHIYYTSGCEAVSCLGVYIYTIIYICLPIAYMYKIIHAFPFSSCFIHGPSRSIFYSQFTSTSATIAALLQLCPVPLPAVIRRQRVKHTLFIYFIYICKVGTRQDGHYSAQGNKQLLLLRLNNKIQYDIISM